MCVKFLELFFNFRDNTVDIVIDVIDLIISLDWIKKLRWETQNDRNSQRCSGNGIKKLKRFFNQCLYLVRHQ